MSIRSRLRSVRQLLADNGWDALLITNPANRRYLTGFTAEDHGADESAGALLVARDTAELYVAPTNLPWAESEVDQALIEVLPFSDSWTASAATQAQSLAAKVIAVEDTTTSAACWFAFQDLMPEGVSIVRAGSAIDALRAVKSSQEIQLLAKAAECTDAALQRAVSQLRPGMTERRAADLIRDALREAGSDGEAFDTIVASGPNAAKPHHRPGERELATGEPIIIDMGARIDGYNGDLTRTVCLGQPDQELATIYEAVLAAQFAGLDAIQADVESSRPDFVTREVFADRGYDQYVIHSAGHGLGLKVHEAPSLSKRATGLLRAGNVVTMEPGLYLPNWGGVRIEDVVVVEEGGYHNLTSAPKGVEMMSI